MIEAICGALLFLLFFPMLASLAFCVFAGVWALLLTCIGRK